MPGRVLQDVSTESIVIKVHTSGTDFLLDAYPKLQEHEATSNIILAHAMEYVEAEQANIIELTTDTVAVQPRKDQRNPLLPPSGYFWFSSWEVGQRRFLKPPKLIIVLSCLSWELGDYPIFLWSSDKPSNLRDGSLRNDHIAALAKALANFVPKERVFAIFGQTVLVEAFASQWTQLGVEQIEEPIYSALLSCCNIDTLKARGATVLPTSHNIRRCVVEDLRSDNLLQALSHMCKGFADESVSEYVYLPTRYKN